jgi:hypothetical protein
MICNVKFTTCLPYRTCWRLYHLLQQALNTLKKVVKLPKSAVWANMW